MNFKKSSTWIYNSFMVIILIAFIGNEIHNEKVARDKFRNSNYSAIIEGIEHHSGDRGIPNIKIGGHWMDLNFYGNKVHDYIRVGDSIVKKSGSEKIEVYRKYITGEWYVKEYK